MSDLSEKSGKWRPSDCLTVWLKGPSAGKHQEITISMFCKETFFYKTGFRIQNLFGYFWKFVWILLHRLGTRKTGLEVPTKPGTRRKTRIVVIFWSFFSQFLANIWSKKFQIMENTKKYISRKSFSRLRWNF